MAAALTCNEVTFQKLSLAVNALKLTLEIHHEGDNEYDVYKMERTGFSCTRDQRTLFDDLAHLIFQALNKL